MYPAGRWIPVFLAVSLVSVPAAAQRQQPSPATEADWSHGSTVAIEGGIATSDSRVRPVLGGAIGWEAAPRLMFEGSAKWLDRDRATAFNAALKVRAGLRRSDVSPFIEGGFGLYRLSDGTADRLPAFYRRRLQGTSVPTFTDPAFHLGGGLNAFVSRKLAIQPAVEAIVVTRGGHAYTVGLVSVRAVYHFEDHFVTLARAGGRR